MKTNQKGFSALEGILIVLVIGLLAGGGWYVYDRQKDKTETTTAPETSESTEPTEETESEEASDEKLAYDDSNLSVRMPKTWSQRTESEAEWLYFESPDFKAPAGDGPGATAEAGYLLEIRVSETTAGGSYENDLKYAPSAQEAHGGFYESIKIDGNDALMSDTKTHGTFIYATTYKNGKTYYFRLNAPDEDKPEVKTLFLEILATVDIK